MPFAYSRTLVPAMLAVVASFGTSLWVSQRRLGSVDGETHMLETDVTPTLRLLYAMSHRLEELDAAAKEDVTARAGPGAAAARTRTLVAQRRLHSAVQAYLGLPFLPGEEERYAPFSTTIAELDDDVHRLLDAADADRARETLADALTPAVAAAQGDLGALVDYDLDLADHQVAAIREARDDAGHLATVLGVASLALSVLTTALAARVMARGAREERVRVHERALREAAEREVRRRDEFLALASHELRTPVTSLLLAVQVLAGRADVSARALGTIERQARRIASLADALVDVSRLAEGPILLRREEVDLGELAHTVLRRFEAALEDAGCAVDLRVDGAVRGAWDRARVEQVLGILLSNAAKFGAGRPVAVEVVRSGDVARVSVRDQGAGISPERLPFIFDRFERGVSVAHYGGLGLGLFVARRVVEAHGGRIGARSRPGEGATFDVELPAEPVPAISVVT